MLIARTQLRLELNKLRQGAPALGADTDDLHGRPWGAETERLVAKGYSDPEAGMAGHLLHP